MLFTDVRDEARKQLNAGRPPTRPTSRSWPASGIPHGREVDRLSQEYPLTAPEDKIEAAKHGNVLFFKETDLVPGHYTLEAVAYDAQGKKASVKTGAVDVPKATPGEVRLFSLVLLSKAEKLSEAEKSADNPLHYGDTILYPNMGEPFRKSLMPALGFYFNVYCPDVTPPKQATVELVKNGQVTAKIPTTLAAPDATGSSTRPPCRSCRSRRARTPCGSPSRTAPRQ